MGFASLEVWFDADVLWFREQPRSLGALAVAAGAIDLPRFDTGLARGVPTPAVRSSVAPPVSALRQRGAQRRTRCHSLRTPEPDGRLESNYLRRLRHWLTWTARGRHSVSEQRETTCTSASGTRADTAVFTVADADEDVPKASFAQWEGNVTGQIDHAPSVPRPTR